jgi:hypothetical protein
MRHLKTALCGAGVAVALAAPLRAEPSVVVELYTSQGCSSCPPADALLRELADDPRVIALALHVDYWDYLGWKDSFAQPKFTERQKAYARAAGERMIYTPQMVIGGIDRVVGNRPDAVLETIAAHAAKPVTIRLTLGRAGDRIVIRAEAVPPRDETLRVQLVRYRPEEEVAIERGENAGHIITYRNIVTSWEGIADWRATAPLEITAAAPGGEPVAVLVQSEGPAEVLAAAALP